MGDVGEHKLGEVGGVHVVGEVLAEAGKGEVGEQVLGGVLLKRILVLWLL